jgi:hypothetical protein
VKKSISLLPISQKTIARHCLGGGLLSETELFWGQENKKLSQARESGTPPSSVGHNQERWSWKGRRLELTEKSWQQGA